MQRHPDKNGNTEAATQAFQELQNAYSVLKDPNERSWCENYSLEYVAGICPKHRPQALRSGTTHTVRCFCGETIHHRRLGPLKVCLNDEPHLQLCPLTRIIPSVPQMLGRHDFF
jgi:hypothetical protein